MELTLLVRRAGTGLGHDAFVMKPIENQNLCVAFDAFLRRCFGTQLRLSGSVRLTNLLFVEAISLSGGWRCLRRWKPSMRKNFAFLARRSSALPQDVPGAALQRSGGLSSAAQLRRYLAETLDVVVHRVTLMMDACFSANLCISRHTRTRWLTFTQFRLSAEQRFPNVGRDSVRQREGSPRQFLLQVSTIPASVHAQGLRKTAHARPTVAPDSRLVARAHSGVELPAWH